MQTRAGREDEANPAKRYLMEYRALLTRRDALLAELEHLRAVTLRATGRLSLTGGMGEHNPGAREDGMLRVVEAEARLAEIIEHAGEALSARLAVIEQLEDERAKALLTLRYIQGLNWERVGYALHYERTRVFELHQQALDAVGRAMGWAADGGAPGPDGAPRG